MVWRRARTWNLGSAGSAGFTGPRAARPGAAGGTKCSFGGGGPLGGSAGSGGHDGGASDQKEWSCRQAVRGETRGREEPRNEPQACAGARACIREKLEIGTLKKLTPGLPRRPLTELLH
jgi:hypothetical protein